MKLDPFQEKGAAFLAASPGKGALLADEPGLGKTRQAIAAAAIHTNFDPFARIGVVCPASAKPVWLREIKECAESVYWRVASFNKADTLTGEFDVLIVDEAHRLKTRNSQRTTVVLGEHCDGVGGLVERAGKVFLLTGTPTPNNPSEIWPLARACFPAAIMHRYKDGKEKAMSHWQFVNRYCKLKQNWLGHPKITGGKNLTELQEALAPHVLRRLKKDILTDLPEARHSVLPVTGAMPPVPFEEEDLVRHVLATEGAEGLRKISAYVATTRRITGLAKTEGVADWVRDWFEGAGGKLVVFAYHKEVMRSLHERFRQDKIKHVVGGPGSDVLFQDDPSVQVFLGQIERDGVAITLTAASTVVLAEQSWVPSDNDQAWQRIHRRGQTRGCQVFYATLAKSLDERIAEALVAKQATIDKLWNSAA